MQIPVAGHIFTYRDYIVDTEHDKRKRNKYSLSNFTAVVSYKRKQ